MKASLFLGALAALPSFINAFSTYGGLDARDIEDEYDTTLSVRDAIPGFSVYDESYELAMRSLEARFTDVAHEIAHSIASRAIEARTGNYRQDKTQAERQHTAAKTQYKQVNQNPSSTHEQKATAAGTARDAAQRVVDIRQQHFDHKTSRQRAPLTPDQEKANKGHQDAIDNWTTSTQKWQGKYDRHTADHAKQQAAGKTRRSIDEFEFLDMLSMFEE